MSASANAIYGARARKDKIVHVLCYAAAAFGLLWLGLILFTLLWNGLAGLSPSVFTQMTPPPGSNTGGLANAIFGSIVMTGIGVGVGAPLGLLAGTYLAEYGRHEKLSFYV